MYSPKNIAEIRVTKIKRTIKIKSLNNQDHPVSNSSNQLELYLKSMTQNNRDIILFND